MRFVVAEWMQETNTFSPVPTGLDMFSDGYIYEGERMLTQLSGTRSQVGAFVYTAKARGFELEPILAANSCSGGPITREAFEYFMQRILDGVRRAGPCDGVLLSLHGAMVSDAEDDVEGALLCAIRREVGPATPIAASLDLHAHVTARMAANADILIGYKTYPHVDMYETGRKTAELLHDVVRGQKGVRVIVRKAPMIVPAENQDTAAGPMADVLAVAAQAEAERGILAASAFPVQPWLDVPGAGFGALVVAEAGCERRAEHWAERMVESAWRERRRFLSRQMTVDEALDYALARAGGPFVFGDGGDAPSSGSPGDNTSILSALLRRTTAEPAMLLLVDPAAVKVCTEAGVGADVQLAVGGRHDASGGPPVTIAGQVLSITDGRFAFTGPGYSGVEQCMGPSVALAVGHIRLALISRPVFMWDPAVYRSLGLEPAEAKLVFVKSPRSYRAFYESIAAEMHSLNSPGVSRSDLVSLPFRRITRPAFPFDDLDTDAWPTRSTRT